MLKSFLARFLPNLVPGLAAFANPWVLVALLAYGVAVFISGVHMEAGRFEAYQSKVTAAGQAQTDRAVRRDELNKQVQKEVDDAYTKDSNELHAAVDDLTRRLRARPGPSAVSAGQQPVGSHCPDGQVCYDREGFDSAFRVYAEDTRSATRSSDDETAGLIAEGAEVKLKLDTAIGWVDTQRKR